MMFRHRLQSEQRKGTAGARQRACRFDEMNRGDRDGHATAPVTTNHDG